ncbi:MAG TPA: hypothetical protein VGK50_03855 [Coriobacteriia bacterium]|jgi:hypothetical protein
MKTALQIGLTALLVGALAFYGGVTYGRMSGRAGIAARFGAQGGQGAFFGGQGGQGANGANANAARFRGGFADGEIISADAKSITVKMPDGSTKTVYLDATTRVVRSAEATASDLTKGTTVVVIGQAASDGSSVTARSIQIVPKGASLDFFRGGMRGFGAPGAQGQNAQGQGANWGGGAAGPSDGGPPAGQ